MEIDFNLYAGKPHGPQDYQSLAMHVEAVRLVLLDDCLAEKALATLLRWETQTSYRSKPLRDAWVEIITNRNWKQALEESEWGNQIRQASPMATLLPNETRFAIIRHVQQLKESLKR